MMAGSAEFKLVPFHNTISEAQPKEAAQSSQNNELSLVATQIIQTRSTKQDSSFSTKDQERRNKEQSHYLQKVVIRCPPTKPR
jgi:hypothetical protein